MKLPYSVTCDVYRTDELEVEAGDDGDVAVHAVRSDVISLSVIITPKKARKLARALLKAADRAEAGE